MKQIEDISEREALYKLSEHIKLLVKEGKSAECEMLIREAMSRYPHAAQPHNLLGVLMELKGDHIGAMKHFRAAWSLDATYLPARKNLDRFSSFRPDSEAAFNESDCIPEKAAGAYKIEYSECCC